MIKIQQNLNISLSNKINKINIIPIFNGKKKKDKEKNIKFNFYVKTYIRLIISIHSLSLLKFLYLFLLQILFSFFRPFWNGMDDHGTNKNPVSRTRRFRIRLYSWTDTRQEVHTTHAGFSGNGPTSLCHFLCSFSLFFSAFFSPLYSKSYFLVTKTSFHWQLCCLFSSFSRYIFRY